MKQEIINTATSTLCTPTRATFCIQRWRTQFCSNDQICRTGRERHVVQGWLRHHCKEPMQKRIRGGTNINLLKYKTIMEIGDKIPEILGIDQDGREIKASDYRGRKIVLYSYPKANTSGCHPCAAAKGCIDSNRAWQSRN